MAFFSRQDKHPLADAKEAKRILADLPAFDPATAVGEATAWFESLAAGTDFRLDLRFERLLQLDAAALPQARRLGRDYLTLGQASRAQEFKLWQANRDYWNALALAYEKCLEDWGRGEKGGEAIKAAPGLLQARLLAAHAGRMKWNQFHYGPIDAAFWTTVGKLYLDAVAAKAALREVSAAAGTTTPAAEYLKILVFHASSMDKLLPLEIEVAERLIGQFFPQFVFTAEARSDNVYWVDAAKPLPPTRLARVPEPSPTLRFFNTGKAAASIAELRLDIAARRALPPELPLGGQYAVDTVLAVLDHLAMCWSPTPPMRSHARHRIDSPLRVVPGLAAFHERLSQPFWADQALETWAIADVSQGGLGASVPNLAAGAKNWLRIGALIGMQPEGGDNWLLGVVRRFSRESEQQGAVGIETLSKTPRAIVADGEGLHTEGILLDPPLAGTIVRLALPESGWEAKIALHADIDGERLRLQPAGLIETGSGFVLGRYTVSTA